MFLVPLEMFWIRVECWRCGKRVLHLATCFFIPFPIHNLGNVFFSFISCSRIVGKVFSGADGGQGFFHSLPVPEFREWIFSVPFPFPNFGNGFFPFPSRSRISGMGFFNSLPVPESSKVIPAHPWSQTPVMRRTDQM